MAKRGFFSRGAAAQAAAAGNDANEANSQVVGTAGAAGSSRVAGVQGAGAGVGSAGAQAADAAPSRVQLFLRASLGDFLLVLAMSVGLVLTVSYAFNSVPDVRGNVAVVAALAAPMLVILFSGSWSHRAVCFSAVGAVAYAVAVVAVCAALTPADVPLFADAQINDDASSPVLFGVVAVVVPAVVFLLSRRRVGMVVLIVAAAVALGAVQFLYRDWITAEPGVAVSVATLAAGLALFAFQSYRSGIRQVKRLERTAFAQATLFAVAMAVACVALGALAFFALIAPLGLNTPEIKPFQDYYTRPVIEYTGVYDEQQVDDPDVTTNQTNDNDNDSNQDADGGEQAQSPENNDVEGTSPVAALVESLTSFDVTDWQEQFAAISYEQMRLGAIMAVLIVAALLAAAIIAQRSRRERRMKKLASEPIEVRIWTIYEFLTGRFAKLGIRRPETLTLMEFALARRAQMAPFARGADGVDFLALTLIYQRACYDKGRITEDDWQAVCRFYRAFFGNARRYVGRRRWLRDFWRM